jgi:penicillin amidase
MPSARLLAAVVVLAAALLVPSAASAQKRRLAIPALNKPVQVVRDAQGTPHVFARSERDVFIAMGWLHAEDRLFQMDVSRRQASGTLSELLGSGSIGSDVQLRTLGLQRAAIRSLAAVSRPSRRILNWYARGVNAWIRTHPLPPEYRRLELTSIPRWTALDSATVAKLLAFGLSFDIGDIANTDKLMAYQRVGGEQGFDGAKLFSEDMMRSEPFAHAASILPGERSRRLRSKARSSSAAGAVSYLDADLRRAVRQALRNADAAGIPTAPGDQGSNTWVVAGSRSASGRPMIANDPHLGLPSPATFYEIGLDVAKPRGCSCFGVSFPGVPGIVQGTNGHVSWGSTVNPSDVTDVYREEVVVENGIPQATVHNGRREPTQVIFESYRANQVGDGETDNLESVPSGGSVPPATVVVPRRNNGPLVSLSGSTGLSVQYTGFGATREIDFFRLLARARDVGQAIRAQRFFDVGAQNWMYVDRLGNVGYKTSSEIPLREDLQRGAVAGLPPWFIRDGKGGNDWIADSRRASDQALEYQILPFDEMDGLTNPRRGWIANANQDPTGTTFDNDPLNELRPGGGIRYINAGHADGNRNARISARLREALSSGDRKVSFAEMRSIQADVKLNDAAVLVPYVTAALRNAQAPGAPPELVALGADPRVQEAVGRLAAWDFSTPTGIEEGWDAADRRGRRSAPSQSEISASVAATIYALWRGQAIAKFVDGPLAARGLGDFTPRSEQAMSALRHMLEGNGTGGSGIVFFDGPNGRDRMILEALRAALDRAASPEFAPAFHGSPNQNDYRWGYLHRIVFEHRLGGSFSIPEGGGFDSVSPDLRGVATDGGYNTVDASTHSPRASTLNGFMFGSGPARRFVAEARRGNPRAVEVIPGGASGHPRSRWFGTQLDLWLTNDYHGVSLRRKAVERRGAQRFRLRP